MDTTRRLSPLVLGGALALTMAILYTLCAAAWAIWHEEALYFLNALFHGLDFRNIRMPETAYSPTLFLIPLAVLTVWGFIAGALFAAIHNLFRLRK
jgi:hypothetical protein